MIDRSETADRYQKALECLKNAIRGEAGRLNDLRREYRAEKA